MKKRIKNFGFAIIAVLIVSNAFMAADIISEDSITLNSILQLSEASAEGNDPTGCTGSNAIYCYNGGCSSSACSISGGISILGCGATTQGSATAESTDHFACCTLRCKSYSKSEYYESQNVSDTDMP